MTELTTAEDKFNFVLKNFHNPNYKLVNDVYLEMLITHLSEKGRSALLIYKTLPDWIDKTLDILTEDFTRLNEKIITFMLKLIALFTEDEWLITEIRDRKIADRIQILFENNVTKLTASEKVAYVRILSAFSTNGLALGWIKRQKAWKILINFCTENPTVYVVRETIKIIYELLYKFSVKKNDDELCLEMLKEIFQPITDNVFDDSKPSVIVNDMDLMRKIKPRLVLIDFILQKTIQSDCKMKITHFCENNFNLEKNLWKLADMTHDNEFLTIILKTMTSLNYAKLVHEKWENCIIPPVEFNQFGVNFFNHMNFMVLRKSCTNILTVTEYNYILWKTLENRTPSEIIIETKSIEFENQLILFQILPVLFVIQPAKNENDEILDTYITKLFEITSEYTQRIVYAFREVIFSCPENICDLAIKSINSILSMQNILNKNHAVVVFQALIYALKEFTVQCKDDARSQKVILPSDMLLQSPNVLRTILICLQTLIQTHHITWKDSIETICVLNLVLDLLNDPNLTYRNTVQCIKLAQLSIEHYLSPNMALLTNNLNESGMQCLGPIIFKRLHDSSWEVRDSTLELVTSIVEISEQKFPAFQKFILDSGVCLIIFEMVKNDEEPYIRASAYKCLTQMITINMLWERCLSKYGILSHLLSSVHNESEGIVRMEAVTLISKIFDSRKIEPNDFQKLCTIMAFCAVKDLHWEVKLKSLNFWKCLIYKEFSNQGMIDGTFPTVTFSKEHKKIITLTENEILLRIQKILDELSTSQCLNVLYECLHDDCDLEVVKYAVDIVKNLLNCLIQYDYIKTIEIENLEIAAPKESIFVTTGHVEEMDVNNEPHEIIDTKIIETIIETKDINLLANNYFNVRNNEDEKCIKNDTNFSRNNIQLMKPKDFIDYISKTNLESLINSKKDWITNTESFESLLEDMVYSIKTLDVNDADCY